MIEHLVQLTEYSISKVIFRVAREFHLHFQSVSIPLLGLQCNSNKPKDNAAENQFNFQVMKRGNSLNSSYCCVSSNHDCNCRRKPEPNEADPATECQKRMRMRKGTRKRKGNGKWQIEKGKWSYRNIGKYPRQCQMRNRVIVLKFERAIKSSECSWMEIEAKQRLPLKSATVLICDAPVRFPLLKTP